jgi:dynein heavy chain
MVQSVARYYNDSTRITVLFSKVSNQIILNCKQNINESNQQGSLWDQDSEKLVHGLKLCLKLNETYQEQYHLMKRKLQEIPSGRQFDCNELQIFGKLDLFCRRITKLIDLFTTIDQFSMLSKNKLEGMGPLIDDFVRNKSELRSRNHDLLDFQNNKFDRDFVEFTVRVSELENKLQQFVNDSFDRMSSISKSLDLLRKFQEILQRDVLRADLDAKLGVLLQNYGLELEQIQQLYENQKHNPPLARNMPPVAGNIMWSRNLLKRIEEPMKIFESYNSVLLGKDAKRVIKLYNKIAKTLVAFEFLWFKSWVQSIDQAKTGLQATLIIRHPYDNKLYVNFDQEIFQLIREAKCLHRMNIEIPESSRIVLFQASENVSFPPSVDFLPCF